MIITFEKLYELQIIIMTVTNKLYIKLIIILIIIINIIINFIIII